MLRSLQVPPYYCVGGEGAEPNRGRKRTFEGRNEPSSRSSSSDENSRSSDSRTTQSSRASIIGLEDGGESIRFTAEGELAVSATVGERGGGAAPAQRHNRSPAHGKDRRATYRDILVERSGATSGEPAAGSGPTGPATEGRRGGGAAPAQRRNLLPARGNGPTTLRG